MHPPAEQSKAPTTWELIQYSDAAVFFFPGRADFSSVYFCESIQFPNKQKAISTPPIYPAYHLLATRVHPCNLH